MKKDLQIVPLLLTHRLSLLMEDVNIHGEVQSISDHLHIITSKLVGFVNTLSMPVCPVELIFKQCQSKWVG